MPRQDPADVTQLVGAPSGQSEVHLLSQLFNGALGAISTPYSPSIPFEPTKGFMLLYLGDNLYVRSACGVRSAQCEGSQLAPFAMLKTSHSCSVASLLPVITVGVLLEPAADKLQDNLGRRRALCIRERLQSSS